MRIWLAALFFCALVLCARSSAARATESTDFSLDVPGGPIVIALIAPGEVAPGPDVPNTRAVGVGAFYMGVVPITRGQFAAFVANANYVTETEKGKSGGGAWKNGKLEQTPGASWRSPGFTQDDNHPVVMITSGDALAYTQWLSRVWGQPVRLPTEAEYAWATRAGKTGKEALALGWFKEESPDGGTHPVHGKPPSAWGLFDMSGNAFAWCIDSVGSRQVARGGSWLRSKGADSAFRIETSPGTRSAEMGMRIAVDRASVQSALASPSKTGPTSNQSTTPEPLSDGDHGPTPTGDKSDILLALGVIGLFGIMAMMFVGFMTWIIIRLVRGNKIKARVESVKADGFFVRVWEAPRTKLRWRAIVKGRRVGGDLIPELGVGTFIYTGGRPDKIQLAIGDEPQRDRYFDDSMPYSPPQVWQQDNDNNTSYGNSSYSSSSNEPYTGGGGDFGGGGATGSYDSAPLGNPRAY